MRKILYSYRATDSKQLCERILERLIYNYGQDDVIAEVHFPKEKAHSYFEDLFEHQISLLIVMIGPSWIGSKARSGVRRLDIPDDPVRLEVETATAKGIPIISVLIRGAELPSADSLPEGMRKLTQATPLIFGYDADFRSGMQKLHRQIASLIVAPDQPQVTGSPILDIPSPSTKDALKHAAAVRLESHRPPFDKVRIETLGEVLWVLRAQRGELGKSFGERQFPPDLSGADLSHVNLSGASLVGAKFGGCNLAYADLSNADLTDATLSDADLTGANLSGAHLDRATMHSAKLQLTNLTGCSLRSADLSDVNLTTAVVGDTSFSGAHLQRSKLGGLGLSNAELDLADLTEADLTEATLTSAHLKGAKLENATLDHADLSSANLSGADLSGASLKLTDMSSAVLFSAIIGEVEEMEDVIIDGGTRFERTKWGGREPVDPRTFTDQDNRLKAYREAAHTNHAIAKMFREAGFVPEASKFRLAEQKALRGILFTNHKYGAWLFSCALNVISGYGERIGRTLATYLTIIASFTLVYFVGTNYLELSTTHLNLYQALLESVVSFHGRGFVASALQLNDPMGGVTVLEAVAGLFVEAIFIATFSRRFLGDN